jgi:hypothetical protein
MDLPPLPGELPASPRLWLAGAGEGAGWRRAAVLISLDGGVSWQDAGVLPMPAAMGHAMSALPPALPASWDRNFSLEVELLSDAMWLENRPEPSVLAGANLALLGDELIQFSTVKVLAPRRFRLSGLLRGRRGTEWAVAEHVAGERFVMLDPAALLVLPLSLEQLGQTILLRAVGAGDAAATPIGVVVGGAGLQPLAPMHLHAVRRNGELQFAWIAQSRVGFGWPDLVDVPPGEVRTAFRVELRDAGGVVAEAEVAVPAWSCPERAGPLWLGVTQLGAAPGRTATFAIS